MRPTQKILVAATIVVAGFTGIYALAYHMFPPPSARVEQTTGPAVPVTIVSPTPPPAASA
ncbi:MAG: hypothetical protein IBJ17_17130, partial [Reyranella sp.]|nr:hypothetical protein [Reyranella sp.]